MRLLKKHWVVALFVALTVAVSIYALVVDKHSVTSSELEARKRNLFPVWRADDISRVTFDVGDRRVELVAKPKKKEDEARTWDVIVDRTTYPADELAADKLLSTLDYALFKREIPKGSVDRKAMGLDSPGETIEVFMGDITMRLTIGGPAPTAGEVYAEVKDRGVYAITEVLANALKPDIDDLRSKTLVPYFSMEFAEIDLSGEGGERALERAPWHGGRGSGFRLKGGGIRADGEVVDRLLEAFGRITAEAFLDDATADKASSPRVTVTLVPKTGPNAVFVIGGACPTKKGQIVAIRKEPTRLNACIKDVMDALATPAASFEDKHLIGATYAEVIEINIKEGDKKLDIARSGVGYKMRSPRDDTVSGDRGNAFLTEMLAVKGELAPDDATLDGDPIDVTVFSAGGVSASSPDDERKEEVSIYRPKDSGARPIALRKEDGRKFYVPRSALHTFAANDLLVRDLGVVNEKAEEMTELAIDGAGKNQLVKKTDHGLDLVEPKARGVVADTELVNAIVGRLAQLRTSRWVAAKDDGSFGLESPRFTLSMKLASSAEKPSRTVKLLLGARTDDGSYAKLEPSDKGSTDQAVFLAREALEEDASKWLVSRGAFHISSESIEKLVIEASGGKRLEVVREGKELRVTTKTERSGNDAAANVADAMDALTPLEAVSVGPEEDYQGFKKPLLKLKATIGGEETTILIGSGDTVDTLAVHYARRSGIDATYAVSQSVVKSLLDVVGVR